MEAESRTQGKDHITLTGYILWQIWKERNNFQFNLKRRESIGIVNKAWQEWMEYEFIIKPLGKV